MEYAMEMSMKIEKLAREGGLGDDVSADETDESASGDDGDLN